MKEYKVLEAATNLHGHTRYYVDIDGIETWITFTKEGHIFDGTFKPGSKGESSQIEAVKRYQGLQS